MGSIMEPGCYLIRLISFGERVRFRACYVIAKLIVIVKVLIVGVDPCSESNLGYIYSGNSICEPVNEIRLKCVPNLL